MSYIVTGNESKVVFLDGQVSRVLRGRIIGKDDQFLYLKRREGTIAINMKAVQKIVNAQGLDKTVESGILDNCTSVIG